MHSYRKNHMGRYEHEYCAATFLKRWSSHCRIVKFECNCLVRKTRVHAENIVVLLICQFKSPLLPLKWGGVRGV